MTNAILIVLESGLHKLMHFYDKKAQWRAKTGIRETRRAKTELEKQEEQKQELEKQEEQKQELEKQEEQKQELEKQEEQKESFVDSVSNEISFEQSKFIPDEAELGGNLMIILLGLQWC